MATDINSNNPNSIENLEEMLIKEEQTTAAEEQPTAAEKQPTAAEEQPTAAEEQPTAAEEQSEELLDEIIDKKIKDFLNKTFAGEKISAALIAKRQSLKSVLIEKIEECKAENISLEVLFETAVSRLPYDIPIETSSQKQIIKVAPKVPISKEEYAAIAKKIMFVLVGLSLILYLIIAGIKNTWLSLAPLAFLPLFVLYYWFAIKRLNWNFNKKRHSQSPLLFTGLFLCIILTMLFFLYRGLAFKNFILILIGSLIVVALVYQTLIKVFLNKSSLVASLVLAPLFATLFYLIFSRFLSEFKLVWLFFVAAGIIDGIIVFAHLPVRKKEKHD